MTEPHIPDSLPRFGDGGRFGSVTYDNHGRTLQKRILQMASALERLLDGMKPTRSRSVAYTRLEDFVLWSGKAIRDDQLARHRDDESGDV